MDFLSLLTFLVIPFLILGGEAGLANAEGRDKSSGVLEIELELSCCLEVYLVYLGGGCCFEESAEEEDFDFLLCFFPFLGETIGVSTVASSFEVVAGIWESIFSYFSSANF